jgi:ABC-2 type transport system permease protein
VEAGDDSMLTGMLAVVEHDFKVFLKYRWFLAGLISMNLADLLIMGVVYTRMVSFNYFRFLAPGIVAMGLFAAAFVIGREVNMETRRGYNLYLLSLPLTRRDLIAGRILAGGIRGLIYAIPLLILAMAILKFPSVIQIGLMLFAMCLLGMGISGLAISLAVILRSFEKFTTARSLLYLLLIFWSSVFYPITVLQQIFKGPLIIIAETNPLSTVSDLLRGYLMGAPAVTAYSWIQLLSVCGALILAGSALYLVAIERST